MTLRLRKRFYILQHSAGVYVMDNHWHTTTVSLIGSAVHIVPKDRRRKRVQVPVPEGADWQAVAHAWHVENQRESPWVDEVAP